VQQHPEHSKEDGNACAEAGEEGSAQEPSKMRTAKGKLVMESQNKLVPHDEGGA